MIKDKFINFYVASVNKELDHLRSKLIENSTIQIEELRRMQGVYEGLQQALSLLKDVIEKEDN